MGHDLVNEPDDIHRSSSMVVDVILDRTEYNRVMKDSNVQLVLEDLDVDLGSRDGMFAMTDVDDSGTISMNQLLETIVLMRGDLKKTDIMATLFEVRNLREKFARSEDL